MWNKKRTLILFGCYWCLKKCKRGLDYLFLCWVNERQTSVGDSFTAVFPKTRHFCNVNLFLDESDFFLFLLFYSTKCVFCQSAFVI